jgi:hypothetical protein
VYYGTPIPNTVTAKRLAIYVEGLWPYLRDNWHPMLTPFREYFFTTTTPIPGFFLSLTALVVFILGIVGTRAMRERQHAVILVPIAVFLVLFFIYRTATYIPEYFSWYTTPPMALFMVFVALGVDRCRRTLSRTASVVAVLIAVMYSIPMFWTWPLEREVQAKIEVAVRLRVGQYLANVMRPRDTVVLEPPGFIGISIPNADILDFPGITSGRAVALLRTRPRGQRSLIRLVVDARPEWIVMRPSETAWLQASEPLVAGEYHQVAAFRAPDDLDLTFGGLTYGSGDTAFVVLRRLNIGPGSP